MHRRKEWLCRPWRSRVMETWNDKSLEKNVTGATQRIMKKKKGKEGITTCCPPSWCCGGHRPSPKQGCVGGRSRPASPLLANKELWCQAILGTWQPPPPTRSFFSPSFSCHSLFVSSPSLPFFSISSFQPLCTFTFILIFSLSFCPPPPLPHSLLPLSSSQSHTTFSSSTVQITIPS